MLRAELITPCVATICLLISSASFGQYYGDKKYGEYYEEEKIWIETEAIHPEFPTDENLVGFYVSAASPNQHFVSPQTVTVAPDGVVRYVTVVKTPSGAVNVSFEGIRCATKAVRLYAFGRVDSTWGRSRNDRWTPIRPGTYQSTLFKEYFCPRGVVIYTANEGVSALRQGGHPLVK